jgi:antitoxin MazE
METSIRKWGNSSAVRLPKPILKTANIGEHDAVEILARKDEIIIRKTHQRKHITLKERMKDWDGVYCTDGELDWGDPVGEEVW